MYYAKDIKDISMIKKKRKDLLAKAGVKIGVKDKEKVRVHVCNE